MARAGWSVLMVVTVAVLAVASSDARQLLGPAPYLQCGGKGGECKGADCKDAAWSGFKCAGNFVCERINEYYYQCNPPKSATPVGSPTGSKAMTPTKTVTATTAAPTVAANSGNAWKQCGGLVGPPCKGKTVCKDAPWGTVTCPTGFACYRSNAWYWGCRTGPVTDGSG